MQDRLSELGLEVISISTTSPNDHKKDEAESTNGVEFMTGFFEEVSELKSILARVTKSVANFEKTTKESLLTVDNIPSNLKKDPFFTLKNPLFPLRISLTI
jgi:hypothetical protein